MYMKLVTDTFLNSELGVDVFLCIVTWNWAIDAIDDSVSDLEECERLRHICNDCFGRWQGYKACIKFLYGVECDFVSNKECFGLRLDDGTNWLFKIEKGK